MKKDMEKGMKNGSPAALFIRGGRVITLAGAEGKTEAPADVLIRDGVICALLPRGGEGGAIPADVTVIDASGCIVAPGLVDPHVHFRDPGQTWKEDIQTGAAAAKAGGYTSVIMMGNTVPHPDNAETLRYMIREGEKTGIRVYAAANVTMGMEGKTLTDMETLAAEGAVLFTDDGLPVRDAEIMREACRRAAALGKTISLHEEDPAYVTEPGINHGAVAEKMGLTGADRQAEIVMVERDIRLAEESGCTLTVQHISAAESVALIRAAKKRGVRVHAEATPHHFALTEEAVERYGTNAKMNPPLRTESDRQAIIEGLRDGTIEMIATDHAPHSPEEKARPFTEAPSGILGLETALSVGLMTLVRPGLLTVGELLEKMSLASARLYGLPGGSIEEGGNADLVIFDPAAERKVSGFFSKSENSPWLTHTLPGTVRMTICGGTVVYDAFSD